jgi:hypothetical protein
VKFQAIARYIRNSEKKKNARLCAGKFPDELRYAQYIAAINHLREQYLAFAMGMHARLGASSPVRDLPRNAVAAIVKCLTSLYNNPNPNFVPSEKLKAQSETEPVLDMIQMEKFLAAAKGPISVPMPVPSDQPQAQLAPPALVALKIARNEAEERLVQSSIAKEKGNSAVKAKHWSTALGYYDSALSALYFVAPTTSIRNSQHDLETACWLNRALCLLHLSQYREAAGMCSKVLEHHSSNVKV